MSAVALLLEAIKTNQTNIEELQGQMQLLVEMHKIMLETIQTMDKTIKEQKEEIQVLKWGH